MNMDSGDFTGHIEQRENIARVHNSIAPIIARFFHEKGVGVQFRVDELRRYVGAHSKIALAPDSAGRIMRDMRSRKWIGYKVVNLRASLYLITSLGERTP
ncbi:hypothetical protein [Bradyrhizobium liaoningense]|uniref:hypothetical protein n=1 Tax=Bradyrhizobium liaoningense TaxID=43992 RepID=UPI0012FD32EA|nr:hypothetical protein [Bradyrhizobium liaoningense]